MEKRFLLRDVNHIYWVFFTILLSVFLLPASITNALQTEEKMPPLVKKVWPSVVIVSTYDQEGKTIKQGTGFFIGKEGDVITSRDLSKEPIA